MKNYIMKVFEGVTPLHFFKDVGIEVIASIMIAMGVWIAAQLSFPLAGMTGVTMVFYQSFGINIGLMSLILNIPLAIICYRLLGHKFFWKTVRCVILSSIIIDGFAAVMTANFPDVTVIDMFKGALASGNGTAASGYTAGTYVVSATISGLLSGIGYALIFAIGSSTGGVDFINLSLKALKPQLHFGRILFVNDFVVIVITSLIMGNPNMIIYGIITAYLISICTDKFVSGLNKCKLALIITDKGESFPDQIDLTTGRGSTLVDVRGGYQFENKNIVIVAVDKRQVQDLEKTIKKIDAKAFTIILDATEIYGEGFKVTRIAERKNLSKKELASLLANK